MFKASSTPSVGLEFMSLRSRVAYSSESARRPFLLFNYKSSLPFKLNKVELVTYIQKVKVTLGIVIMSDLNHIYIY